MPPVRQYKPPSSYLSKKRFHSIIPVLNGWNYKKPPPFETDLEIKAYRLMDRCGYPGQEPTEVCPFYLQGSCLQGESCPKAHISKNSRTMVCKHYRRGLCKKGDDCEFLHSYDLSKMAECFYFNNHGIIYYLSHLGECNNPDCQFRHVDPTERASECPFYTRGFCKWGPSCKNRHTPKKLCLSYLEGFCPDGPTCALAHPFWEIPDNITDKFANNHVSTGVTCYTCGKPGHKAPQCPDKAHFGKERSGSRNVKEVTCFKCGEAGHYANACPNGFRPNQFTDPRKVRGRDKQTQLNSFMKENGPTHFSEHIAEEQRRQLEQLQTQDGNRRRNRY